ncbi:hypothetical protein ONA91_26565 [Micromonospora sp. DR5-3]|uniref:hypothetical protein n=1 Tax=unclassified Micromonospora TaxID=2617518 RepID=UPI0011DB85D6|nr:MULTISPECIES: hypothetical protein [unclassified Micromonospora]MCW3818018.1 hypothetical protein [Micromonospora sp. DR5-3]TYC26319.1 hypothetical protein FXF52_02925 [Micromonospora sp. MP36]
MRVFDRLTAVVVALAFVLAGLGVPGRGETPEPGAVVTAAHRSIVHDAPSALPPHGRPVDVTTSDRPAPPSGDPRAVVARLAHLDAPSDVWTALPDGNRGDHRAGVVSNDGPDDLLPAALVRVGGTPDPAAAPTRYRQPAVPLPPRGTLPTRAPPTVA